MPTCGVSWHSMAAGRFSNGTRASTGWRNCSRSIKSWSAASAPIHRPHERETTPDRGEAGKGAVMRHGLKIAFFGSSLVSAYWNGAATYYRGILRALHQHGHQITFYEPDA